MSDNTKSEQQTREPATGKAIQTVLDSEVTRGVMKLACPIRAKSQDVTELNYDFSKLTGWEYVEAMDADASARNVFKISQKQAFCLFATAAGKATPDVDATDIRERMSAVDAVKAVQLATVFLVASMRAERASS